MKFTIGLSLALSSLALSSCAVAQSPVEAAAPTQTTDQPKTILFVGNSFTFGAGSGVLRYKADTVTDLNGDGIGGVPALFKSFTAQAGLNYEVSLETAPGRSLEWHWTNKRDLIDKEWDYVMLQDYSTLDPKNPGNPANLIIYSDRLAHMFKARNPDVHVRLTATWSRADQTYKSGGHWYGKPISQMALDLDQAYHQAAHSSKAVDGVNPVGKAFNCAMEAGFADANPYDGISYDQVDLLTYDHYHASTAGYYLEALTIYAGITGKDPRDFGGGERAAQELGLSGEQAVRLQKAAWAVTHGETCQSLGK